MEAKMKPFMLLAVVLLATLSVLPGCVTPPPQAPPAPAVGAPTAAAAPAAGTAGTLKFEFVSVTDPVNKGDAITVKGKTAPGTECTLAMNYSDGSAATIPGLTNKTITSDADGNAVWNWSLFNHTPSGKTTFSVTAKKGSDTATASTTCTVK
jgi:hypothetical protein